MYRYCTGVPGTGRRTVPVPGTRYSTVYRYLYRYRYRLCIPESISVRVRVRVHSIVSGVVRRRTDQNTRTKVVVLVVFIAKYQNYYVMKERLINDLHLFYTSE